MATTRYVWEKYKTKWDTQRRNASSVSFTYGGAVGTYPNFGIDAYGKIYVTGTVQNAWGYRMRGNDCFYGYHSGAYDDYTNIFHADQQVVPVGTKTGDRLATVSSAKSNAYTTGATVGSADYYEYKGSDNIDPSALTYSDAVTAGQNVTLTIAPSTGTTLGGNISYVIQTTTNGTDWYDAGETSEISYTVTVPADAIVWNVRVYAKDDTGFTSSTYIYGNGVDTYVNVIRVGISPDSGDIGYITSPQVMFVSINTDTDYTFTVKLDGETLSSSSSSSAIQHIILSDEKFNSLKEETKYTLTVEIAQSGATITRTYTFQKFVYDDTTLGGVMEGTGKALRIKRKIQSQIVGANIPKEIIKIDNPIGVSDLAAATASEAQVFKGYTFFSGDNELKTGTALGTTTTVAADKLLSGITAYNNLGQLITGTLANPYQLYVDTRSTSISFTRHHDDDDYYSNVYWVGSSTIYLPHSNAAYVMAHITVKAGYDALYSGENVLSKVNGNWIASVNAGLHCYGSGNYINIGGNATYGNDPQGATANVIFYSFVKIE